MTQGLARIAADRRSEFASWIRRPSLICRRRISSRPDMFRARSTFPRRMLAGWAGWVVDYSKPAYLIADPSQLPEATRVLRKIGLDDVRGYFDVSKVREAGLATESYETAKPSELASRIEVGRSDAD